MKRIKYMHVKKKLFMGLIIMGLSSNAMADNGLGTAIDKHCTNNNKIPAKPYAGKCTICHDKGAKGGSGAGRTAYLTANIDFFCRAPAVNAPPLANAGPDQSVIEKDQVTLNAAASTDADGDPLTYSWSFASIPTGSAAALSDGTVISPTFVADKVGGYTLALVVNDGKVDSAANEVVITAGAGNTAPVSNAGPDQAVATTDVVTLNSSGSTDVDGDQLTYSWVFTAMPTGSMAILSDATSAMPTFTVDIAGTYALELVVNDGLENSMADAVSIVATNANVAPVANAGMDQAVATKVGTVTLDGSGSVDADGDNLTYSWVFKSKPVGSVASLSNAKVAKPSFIADIDGDYVAELIVNDGLVDSSPKTVKITAATKVVPPVNIAPVSNAGNDQSTQTGSVIVLDGSGSSDTNKDPLLYGWSFITVPAGSQATLSDPTVAMPTFTADIAGNYVVELVVNDGQLNSMADRVSITVKNAPVVNVAPVANAGIDQAVVTNVDTVTLNGSDSTDADGDNLTFSWTFTAKPAGSAVTLSDPKVVNPNFIADVDGDYVLQLIVNDGKVDSKPKTVKITATAKVKPPVNIAPVAHAGIDQNTKTGSKVTLNGSDSSDANMDPLLYDWSILSMPVGSMATLSDPTVVMPSFVADIAGNYVIQLMVNDGLVNSAPVTVTIKASDKVVVKPTTVKQKLRVKPSRLNIHSKRLGRKAVKVKLKIKNKAWERGSDTNVAIPVLVDVFLTKPDGTVETLKQKRKTLKRVAKVRAKFRPTMSGEYLVKTVVTDEAGNELSSTTRKVTVNVKSDNHHKRGKRHHHYYWKGKKHDDDHKRGRKHHD